MKLGDTATYHQDIALKVTSHVSGTYGATPRNLPSFFANVEVYDPTAKNSRILIEDITFTALASATETDDRELFFNTVWDHDITDCLLPESLQRLVLQYKHADFFETIASSHIRNLKFRGLLKGEEKVSRQLIDTATHDYQSISTRDREHMSSSYGDIVIGLKPELLPHTDFSAMDAHWKSLSFSSFCDWR